MCGISGIFGKACDEKKLRAMVQAQDHRGPDAQGIYLGEGGLCALGHNRLSILDLSAAGNQPMSDASGRYRIVYNGEIYNYLELREELKAKFQFRTQTDTEVLLAAYLLWGKACLDRLVGMFSFLLWDEKEKVLFAARDRFGVKPLYFAVEAGNLYLASEIKALHAAGVAREPDPAAWAAYLAHGLYDHSEKTFWKRIASVPPGGFLVWKDSRLTSGIWYDLAEKAGGDPDPRAEDSAAEEYKALLDQSIAFRFRADVPVGINLSGGLDSSLLLALVHRLQGPGSNVKAFTFVTGDPAYDELPWVQAMLKNTKHPHVVCPLTPEEVPSLAEQIQSFQEEPFGGIPTLAYAKVFQAARREGIVVLLDGQGMDEQWAGYDYYQSASAETAVVIQASGAHSPVKPECLETGFAALAEPLAKTRSFTSALRNLQYRDIRYTKLPRALRFNDRISMASSTELREPFLDHRLVELSLRQPDARKIAGGVSKRLLRKIAQGLMPKEITEAPKRGLQTPQREWLRGPLKEWAGAQIECGLAGWGGQWLEAKKVRAEAARYFNGTDGHSFFIWQWISLGLLNSRCRAVSQ